MPDDAVDVLRELGVIGPVKTRRIHTARISWEDVEKLSDQDWVKCISASRDLGYK